MRHALWIILVGPNSNDRCPFKTGAKRDLAGRRRSNSKETKTGVVWSQVKEHQQPGEAERGKKFSRETTERGPACTWVVNIWSPEP